MFLAKFSQFRNLQETANKKWNQESPVQFLSIQPKRLVLFAMKFLKQQVKNPWSQTKKQSLKTRLIVYIKPWSHLDYAAPTLTPKIQRDADPNKQNLPWYRSRSIQIKQHKVPRSILKKETALACTERYCKLASTWKEFLSLRTIFDIFAIFNYKACSPTNSYQEKQLSSTQWRKMYL